MKHQTCPNCAADGMEVFYEAHRIPVHSCMMLTDRAAALDFPTRDLALGSCQSCGFISNVLFDPGVQHYTTGYEEQQSFSPSFRSFQTQLIERLIERYGLRGKSVVEIGCGKGDFLIELCQRGGNTGVGIDPSCDPERVAEESESHVRLIKDVYSNRYADLPCDFLCCRHTLEHIHQTSDFVRLMREVVGNKPEVTVFLEVPAIERVLSEEAFWDIYYEHCSYFSLGSLARVCRANRLDVVELETDFDDQYLILTARPVGSPTEASMPQENDIAALRDALGSFRRRVTDTVDRWRNDIRSWQESGRRVVIWGSGSKCVSFLSAVGLPEAIDAVVDINPHRHGKFLAGSGKEVVAPESLAASPPDVVIVMNPIYVDEIGRDLAAMGITADVRAV